MIIRCITVDPELYDPFDRDCSCTVVGVNGDPDQWIRLDRYCAVHGLDPDDERDRDRDDRSFN
jgi:hypothetical protein